MFLKIPFSDDSLVKQPIPSEKMIHVVRRGRDDVKHAWLDGHFILPDALTKLSDWSKLVSNFSKTFYQISQTFFLVL